jgi:hypothetical protein
MAALLVIGASLALTFTRGRSLITEKRSIAAAGSTSDKMPQVVLWAWERPTDLSFINPKDTAVAILVRTIRLKANDVQVRPRMQPLSIPEGSKVIAVARIESDRKSNPALSADQRTKISRELAAMATLPNITEIQIDFDATQSEREFYRRLIFEVRMQLPAEIRLSITALASWCQYDNWLSDLPIDEAVPMLFRMAGDGKQIADGLAAGDDFKAAPCRHSYGVSLDEPRVNLSRERRLYIFNPDQWTETAVHKILESRR